LFHREINENSTLRELLTILCDATEYDDLPVRHNEDKLNGELAEKVKWEVDTRVLDSPHTKTCLLLQAHFSHLELPIADYYTDLKSALDQSVRILQAIVDVSADSGWLFTTLNSIQLMQMVMQGQWFDDSTLLTLPHFNNKLVNLFKQKKITCLPELLDLYKTNKKELISVLSKVLSQEQIDKVFLLLGYWNVC